MLTIEFSNRRRVAVADDALWRELFPLTQLLRLVPEAAQYQAFHDGRRAVAETYLSIGAVKWNVVAEAQIDVAEAPSLLQWSATVPSMRLEFVGVFRIERQDDAVTLSYEGQVECGHPLSRMMKGTLVAMLEDHVDHVLEGAADAATKHVEAARRLSRRAGRGEQ